MIRTRTSSARTCLASERTDLASLSAAELDDFLDLDTLHDATLVADTTSGTDDMLADDQHPPEARRFLSDPLYQLHQDPLQDPFHQDLLLSLHPYQDQQDDPFSTHSRPCGTKREFEEEEFPTKSKKDKLRTWVANAIPWQWVKDEFLDPCETTLEEHSINKVCIATCSKEVHICVTFGGNPCREAKVFATLLKAKAPTQLLCAFTPLKGGAVVALCKEWSLLYGAMHLKLVDITHRGIKRTKGTCIVKQLQEELAKVKGENAQLKDYVARLEAQLEPKTSLA